MQTNLDGRFLSVLRAMNLGRAARARSRRHIATSESPTALSLEFLRRAGWNPLVVEVNMRIPREGEDEEDLVYKKDLFGFLDIVALKPGCGTLGVQTTSRTNLSARVRKIQCCAWFEWVKLAGGWSVHVHGWGPKGLEVVDMLAKNADGTWLYPTDWAQILLAEQAKRKTAVERNQRFLFEEANAKRTLRRDE